MSKNNRQSKKPYSLFTRMMALVLAVLLTGSVIVYALMEWL